MIVRYYRAAFALALGALVLGVAAGSYRSVVGDHRLPPLVFQNMTEIEALMAQRRYDEAIARLEMTLELVPAQRHLTHNVLGNAYAAQGRQAEAIAQYRLALGAAPGLAEAHNNLGVALLRTGAGRDGLQELSRALEQKRDYGNAWDNLERGMRSAEAARLDPADPVVARAAALLVEAGRTPSAAPAPGPAAAEQDSADSPARPVGGCCSPCLSPRPGRGGGSARGGR